MNLLLLSTSTSTAFAQRLAASLGAPLAAMDRREFPDGERYLRLPLADHLDLLGKDVVLVGATDTDAHLNELYRAGCAAAKGGARTLVLVIPYFGYSTMERSTKAGEVVTAKTIARQLSAIPRAQRGNWTILMDLHSAGIVHYFEGDMVALELYAETRIVEAIQELDLKDLCLASTDMGRAKWVETFANRLHAPVALIHKKRISGSQTRINAVVGDVAGKNVVIFDDMIRTGGSLLQAVDAYLKAGAVSVHAVATHLVLPTGTIEKLESSQLASITGTDTHPRHQELAGRPRWRIVSVAPIFAEVVGRLVM